MTAVASTLGAGLGYALDIPIGPTAALYLLAAGSDEAHPWTPRTTAAVAGMLVAYVGATAAAGRAFPGLEPFHTSLAWAIAWFAGERTRLLRQKLADLERRAVDAQRHAERDRRLAIAEERARISRDLHDSMGHAISVIGVRAGAARLRHRDDPGRSLVALEAIEDLARQTVGEINLIVDAVRGGPADMEPPPGLASLDTLIAHHTAAGLDVTLHVAGRRWPLAGSADHAVYRILQEALTNAARHGTGSARIELSFGDDGVELAVRNPVSAEVAQRTSGGHGTIGMRERATLVGGAFEACQRGDEFRTRAWIPYGGGGHRG
jgi:signal transduction histidine kinase